MCKGRHGQAHVPSSRQGSQGQQRKEWQCRLLVQCGLAMACLSLLEAEGGSPPQVC